MWVPSAKSSTAIFPAALILTRSRFYDGVGIGIQDTTIVKTIYHQAVAKSLGTRVAFS